MVAILQGDLKLEILWFVGSGFIGCGLFGIVWRVLGGRRPGAAASVAWATDLPLPPADACYREQVCLEVIRTLLDLGPRRPVAWSGIALVGQPGRKLLSGEAHGQVMLLHEQALLDALTRGTEAAWVAAQRSWEIAAETGDLWLQALTLYFLALLSGWGAHLSEGVHYLERMVATGADASDGFLSIAALYRLALLYHVMGQVAQSQAAQASAEQLAHERSLHVLDGWSQWLNGDRAALRGHWQEAETLLNQALAAMRQRDERLHIAVLQSLARVACYRGQLDEAERYYQQARVMAIGIDWSMGATALLGAFCAQFRDAALAETLLSDAQAREPLGLATEFYLPALVAAKVALERLDEACALRPRLSLLSGRCYAGSVVDRVLGELAAALGESEAAAAYFASAEAWCRRTGAEPELALVLIDRAHLVLTSRDANQEQVRAYCAEAQQIAVALELPAILSAAEALLKPLVPSVSRKPPGPPEPADGPETVLTPRELEVLRLVVEGRTDREIAHTLLISPKTVSRHLTNIFNKIGTSSRTAAAAYALRHRLV